MAAQGRIAVVGGPGFTGAAAAGAGGVDHRRRAESGCSRRCLGTADIPQRRGEDTGSCGSFRGLSSASRAATGAALRQRPVRSRTITRAAGRRCPPFATLAAKVVGLLEACDLTGYNVRPFDLPLLAAELDRCGLGFPLEGRAALDAMPIFHDHEPRDLAAAFAFDYGVRPDGLHSAVRDVLAAAMVLDAPLERYSELPRDTAGLHRYSADVDVAGCFRRQDGQLLLDFGKFRGRPLDEVARTDPDDLRWMVTTGVLDDAK